MRQRVTAIASERRLLPALALHLSGRTLHDTGLTQGVAAALTVLGAWYLCRAFMRRDEPRPMPRGDKHGEVGAVVSPVVGSRRRFGAAMAARGPHRRELEHHRTGDPPGGWAVAYDGPETTYGATRVFLRTVSSK